MRRKFINTYLPILCMLMFMALYFGCQGCNRAQVSPSESRQHMGIPNIGNTCYVNSCLQILARLYPDLFSHMSDDLGRHGQTIADKITDETNRKYVDEKEAWVFYNALLKSYNNKHEEKLNHGSQGDAAQVLLFLLDRSNIQRVELYPITTHPKGHHGPNITNAPDPYVLLSVDFTGANQESSKNPVSMDKLVADTLHGKEAKDFIWGNNEDEEIREDAIAGTRLSIRNLYELTNRILPIWVHRCTQTSNDDPRSAAKITTPIINPFKLTIPPEYFITEKAAYTGSLVGFILQTGEIDYGHYTAYVKTPAGRWIRYNDETVTELCGAPLSEAQAAYLYFYQAD